VTRGQLPQRAGSLGLTAVGGALPVVVCYQRLILRCDIKAGYIDCTNPAFVLTLNQWTNWTSCLILSPMYISQVSRTHVLKF